MSVILKSISLPPLRLFSDLILLAFSPKNRNFLYVIFRPPGIFRITHTHTNDASAITTISPGTAIHAVRSHGFMYFL